MRLVLTASTLAIAAVPALASPASPSAVKPAPLSSLVNAVSIPYQRFTLDNGLTVLVHTDRKAPVVAVSVWYGVGSKHEPKGKTGFAHLFEHLMFNGSENAPGDFFEPLQQVGATDTNGTTWFDRTNYFETVPTGALDMTLMLESDRMGHLLGGITQKKLDNQRSVVQNEKRQGDNRPFGLVEYEQLENLYPSGHPYHHSTIGSMADLDSASLDDVKGWFRQNYGPNNAILVLAGDIDLPTAKTKVAKWFGEIPAGPKLQPVSAPVPTLPAPIAKTIKDQVSTTRIYRMWAVPGVDNHDALPLAMAASVLGGLASSRLDDALVRTSQDAVSVSADAELFAQAGQLVIYADVKPGKDPAAVASALDAQIAKFIAEGPTADELERAATSYAVGQIRTLESVGGFGGKAPTLAEGLLFNGDPDTYKKDLKRAATLTPAEVRAAAAKWLTRPVFALTVEPGKREQGGEARGGYVVAPPAPGAGAAGPAWYSNPALADAAGQTGAAHVDHVGHDIVPAPAAKPDRSRLPDVGALAPLDFPTIERATLPNGMKVFFARRAAVPTVAVRVSFDAGSGADPKDALGTQSLLLNLMEQGTTSLNASQLAAQRERLGVTIRGMADADTTSFQMDAVTPNLAPSLALLADYIRKPALDPQELERVRAQQLTAIANEFNNPGALAGRVLAPALYGTAHPYGNPPSGSGDPKVVKALTRDQLATFHATWFRPDTAKIFVVGDTTLKQVTRMLQANFGSWPTPRSVPPRKDYSAAIPALSPRIILVDRPGAPQSMIQAGRVLALKGSDDQLALQSANDVLGGNFLGRINTDLRETKGWSYGAYSFVTQPLDRESFRVQAPVQSDKTGEAIKAIRQQLSDFTTAKGVTPEELKWTTNGSIRELPGSFETAAAVLGGVASIVKLGRPDNYYETLAARYSAMTTAQLDQAARAQIGDGGMVYVVVGDAAKVRPQLDGLGLPVETANPVDTAPASGK